MFDCHDQYEFHLPSHKADPFFEGNHILIKSQQYCDINPLTAFTIYLDSRDRKFPLLSPLWLTSSGSIPTHTSLFYCQASALFQTRHGWSVHESWRHHFPCRKRCPSVSHPTHWSLVFRCFLYIHMKKPCPNPSSSLFSTKSLISL